MKSKLIRKFSLPTDKKNLAINAGIAADSDTFEFTNADFSRLQPIKSGDLTKVRIPVKLSPDVVNAFRATGAGWQDRIDVALKEWITQHPQSIQ
jgi:uncharacterized protein (DUF4415 family)